MVREAPFAVFSALLTESLASEFFLDSLAFGGLLACCQRVYDVPREIPLMPGLDWSQCPAVESVPGRVSGAWVFRGTRMPVATVFENLEAGAAVEDIMEWFDLTREQVTTILDFAARSLAVPTQR
jgi:uncharacterized protein (DUF433 family)